MKTEPTFTATIYVGLKERDSGLIYSILDAEKAIQEYVDEIGLCVTITPTKYIYTNGAEPGFAIGLINYPRFPDTPENIKNKALMLGERLRKLFRQYKVSVVFPNETVMLESGGDS